MESTKGVTAEFGTIATKTTFTLEVSNGASARTKTEFPNLFWDPFGNPITVTPGNVTVDLTPIDFTFNFIWQWYTYAAGETVTATADADAGYTFDHWSGDADGTTSTVSVVMDSDKSISAVYRQITLNPVPRTLAIYNTPSGAGSASKSPDQAEYDDFSTVVLEATANDGYLFNYWTGDITTPANPVGISVGYNTEITAVFSGIIVLCIDGWLNSEGIYGAVEEAAEREEVGLIENLNWTRALSNVWYFPPGTPGEPELEDYEDDIDSMVYANLCEKSNINILLVGKSYGGAKLYLLLFELAAKLNDFRKVAVVFVDAHDPHPFGPGSEDIPNYWFQYVVFSGSYPSHNLMWHPWWQNTFGLSSASDQQRSTAQLRIYNLYQRDDRLTAEGYSFVSAYKNIDLSGQEVTHYVDGLREDVAHMNIETSTDTVELIQEAFRFLKE